MKWTVALTAAALLAVAPALLAGGADLSLSYRFGQPELTKGSLGQRGSGLEVQEITLKDCRTIGHLAEPTLPLRAARILLPQGYDLDSIEVTPAGQYEIGSGIVLKPAQEQAPLDRLQPGKVTMPDPQVYGLAKAFPGTLYKDVNVQWGHGYQILYFNLCPVQYVPAEGRLYGYRQLDVVVHVKQAGPRSAQVMSCRGLEKDRMKVRGQVDNPELVDSYVKETSRIPSHLDGREEYPHVIITNEALQGASGEFTFQDLRDHKTARGETSTIVTVEWIYSTYPGVDNQEKIRNFIIDAYNNWNTDWVVLGGDGDVADIGGESGDDIVPTRGLWSDTDYGTTDSAIPADLYYGCLDGSFNADGDGTWGEYNDGPGGGECDLLYEVYPGRIPSDNDTELSEHIRKIIWYETLNPQVPELKNAMMLGELLWSDPTYG